MALASYRRPDGVGALSQREIADRAGVSDVYVGKVLRDPELRTSSQLPDRRQGQDGKVRPATRPPAVVAAKDHAEEVKARDALALIPADVGSGREGSPGHPHAPHVRFPLLPGHPGAILSSLSVPGG